MLNKGMECTVLMIRRTAKFNPNSIVLSHTILEFLDKPGFANPGFTTEQDDLPFAVRGLLLTAPQQRQFFFPTHQGRESSLHGHIKAAVGLALFYDSIER